MIQQGRRGILLAGFLAASLGAIGLVVLLRSDDSPPKAPAPSPEIQSRARLQDALHDASLQGLIQNARVATRKGDDVTRRAMVAGLKKDSRRARDLIHRELTSTSDSTDISILNGLVSELMP